MDIRPIDAKDLSLIIRKHIPALGYGVRDSFLRKAVDKTTVECLHFTLDKIDNAPTLSLNTLRDAIYQDAVEHGLWGAKDYPSDCAWKIREEADELCDAGNNWEDEGWSEDEENEAFSEELADVAIMVFSVAGKLGIDIDAAIRRKMEINKGRKWKHGKE